MKKLLPKKAVRLSTITVWIIGIAVTVAVAIFLTLFSAYYNHSLLRSAAVSSEQVVEQSAVAVNNYLDSMKEKLTKISDQIALSNSKEEFSETVNLTVQLQSDIYAIMIYDENGNIILCQNEHSDIQKDKYKDLSFDKELFSKSDEFILTSPHVQTIFEGEYPWVVTLAKKQESDKFGGTIYIAIDFKFSEIAKYIDNVGIGPHGYCYIIDERGNIVYHPQQQLLYSGLKDEDNEKIRTYSDGVYNENDKIYTIGTTNDNNWRIVGVHYTDELTADRKTQMLFGIAIALLCCVVIVILFRMLYSNIVNKPVRELVSAMKTFEEEPEAFEYKPNVQTVHEIKVLYDSFDDLAYRTKDLMEQVRREEVVLRKTELKALQAQINPHFLYNTLDSIQWMCENKNNDDAVKMVGALAKLFRISISRGHELITIKDEIQHAQSYLIIQSFRYRNQFSYHFDVEDDLLDCLCNKITIQPLIENAIYHGIDRMVDEGEINITVKSSDDGDILITVSDNGVGMTAEQCKKILSKDRSDSGGIGVKNVDDRLKIYFGEKYGLSIESELDVGTTVTVRIPKIRKESEHEA